jgi:hypothetical protein
VDSDVDIVRVLHTRWARKSGWLRLIGLVLGAGLVATSSIVMYEAYSNTVFAVGVVAAGGFVLFGASMLVFAGLPPRRASRADEVGNGRVFTMNPLGQWASALWLWSALVSCGLCFIGIGLNHASRTGGGSDNGIWWLVLGALGIGASIFSPLRYVGRFRIDIDGDGMRMELGRAYSGYVRWSDVSAIEPSDRGRYPLDLVLEPGVRVENTSPWSSLYRLGPGIITEASPFQDGYVRLECGGWTSETSALLEEIAYHVIAEDPTEQEADS